MPLIPAFLRLMIATLGKLGLISTINCTNTIKTTIQRIIFYVGMFLFRFVGLYLFLDKMEGLILASHAMQSPSFANCWYTSFLREEKRGEKCYGQEFDYSDHVVYFFAHIQTSMLFEFLFCFLVPIWPVNSRQPDYVSNKKTTMTTKHTLAVMRLYRSALLSSRSWSVDTDIYIANRIALRERFDNNKHERNYVKAKKMLEDGQAEFKLHKHPDVYKPCQALDGTKWERNIPPPAETCQMTPEEASWYNDKSNWN